MKSRNFGFLGALALAVTLFASGCVDDCKDVNCNSGECVEGECVCNAGYEGEFCETAFNAKFSGTYSLSETCDTTGSDNYSVTVAPSTSDASIANITGLYREAQASVPAVIGANGVSFTIATTDVGPGTIQSTGSCTSNASGSTINVIYKFTNETTSASENCTAVLTRQ